MKMPFGSKEAPKPKVETPDDRMTLIEHLAELRTRIIRSLLAVVLGIIIVLAFYNTVLEFLRDPYERLCADRPDLTCDAGLQFISPLEGLSTRLQVSTYGGILLALPVLLWQVWQFVVPALHAKEKKYAIPFVGSCIALFALGGYLAYWTLEKALEFLIDWAGDGVEANFRVGEYIRLVGMMVAAFGIAFQFPVLLVGLQLIGVLTPQTLLKGWRYAIMGCFVIAAVITPSGDPFSMLALALPMSVFFFLSVLIGWLVQRSKRKRDAAAV
jgi:sec-independent protein translocase protein TatC